MKPGEGKTMAATERKSAEDYVRQIEQVERALATTPPYLLVAWELSYSEVQDLLEAETERQKSLRQLRARLRARLRRMTDT